MGLISDMGDSYSVNVVFVENEVIFKVFYFLLRYLYDKYQ